MGEIERISQKTTGNFEKRTSAGNLKALKNFKYENTENMFL